MKRPAGKRTVEKHIRIALRAAMTAVRTLKRAMNEHPDTAHLDAERAHASELYNRLHLKLRAREGRP